jgi:hypothetical protein
MTGKLDYKKDEKMYYLPAEHPVLITIPEMKFFMISGKGDPNTSESFSDAVQALYSLSYSIKMSPKSGNAPEQYQEYTIYPLEGVWDLEQADESSDFSRLDKNRFIYTLMIRQPDFVSESFAEEILGIVKKKKPNPKLDEARFETFQEGLCVQMMHIGSFDSESRSFQKIEQFLIEQGLSRISHTHREIYLSDPRKTAPEKLRTVLRCQIH